MINDNVVVIHKDEYKILMENSVLANLTRKFLNECTADSDYQNISCLRFIYDISLKNEKEDT